MAFPHPRDFHTVPLRSTTEIPRDGYKLLKDIYIPTRDGSVLCCNVYLPLQQQDGGDTFPVLLTLGPYGKDIHFSEFGKPHTDMYANMAKEIEPLGPDACFETPDPVVWCKEYGYAVVRCDVRGSGGSPGVLDPFGLGRTVVIGDDSEGLDAYDVVEWAGTQPWSNGKVAMCGISYYGMACYWAAMQQPPHLAAIVPYEALTDMYADSTRQGGVWHAGFQNHWFSNIVIPQQYGRSEGLDDEQLAKQRFDMTALATNWIWRSEGPWPIFDRVRDLAKIKVPMLTAGNWMDSEVHLPGNPTSFERASSSYKFLEMHTGNHLGAYYEPQQIHRQRQFLDYFLKDNNNKKDNGLDSAPRIDLLIRRGLETFYRVEESWPPHDTTYTPLYLSPENKLSFTAPTLHSAENHQVIEYPGLTGSATFMTDPLPSSLEILGYPSLELTLSTTARDMDLFIYFSILPPPSSSSAPPQKIVFRGNHNEPAVSFLRSWFRLSHRTLSPSSSPSSSTPQHNRVHLSQMQPAPVHPSTPYTVTIPVPPTSMIVQKGYRLVVDLRASDEEEIIPPMRHVGPDREESVFGGLNRIALGGKVVLPVVKREGS